MCKIVFALFLHSRSPLFERNDQLLRKRISLDYIKSKLLPIRLQKLKYQSSCISAKHLYGQIPYFGHGWHVFEGFDFVVEAADIGSLLSVVGMHFQPVRQFQRLSFLDGDRSRVHR